MDFTCNLHNVLGGYNKTLCRLLGGVMKRPEPHGEGANNGREKTIFNTNGELYSVLFFVTTGSA